MASCSNSVDYSELWNSATYTENTELGSGSKTVVTELKVGSKTVEFTIHTDKETLGDALKEHNLIFGEEGAYGLYVKIVNGIKADYDENKSYWSFTKNGEYISTGVDAIKFKDMEHYEITYTGE